MATNHATSVVKTNCYTAPRISKTDRPATVKELNQKRYGNKFRQKSEASVEENEVLAKEPSRTPTVGRHAYTKHLDASLTYETGDPVSEEQFYQNLLKLKEEHKKTLKLLETKYYEELRNQNNFQWEGFTNGVGLKQQNGSEEESSNDISRPSHSHNRQRHNDRIFHKPPKSPVVQDIVRDMSHSTIASEQDVDDDKENSDESEDDESEENKDPNRSPEEFSSSLFPKRSAAMDMVEDLWRDFSVRDYTMNDNETIEHQELKKPKEKEWTPAITVPKPFTMSLRAATKEKRKTRSMKMIEEELVLKKSLEEAELKKKFRAQPVPATTFLPLYDEIIEKNNRRSEHVRELNKAILKATEKPFSFIKREEQKKQRKEEQKRIMEDLKARDGHERSAFKARPPPKHKDDLTLADRLTEQEEYRKIRKKLRAAELLAKSHLPPSMEARANISPAAKSRQKCRRKHEENATEGKPKFRPHINPDIPDFDALHWEFEKELRRKKKERQPTVTEPFNLRTARIPRGERSLRRARSMENLGHSLESPIGSRKSRPYSARLSSSQDTLPFGTTESARLREKTIRKSLEMQKQRDSEISREMKEKRKREKLLRSQVAVKAMANDHSWQLRKTQEEKLRNFRETDRGRQEEYEQELTEMQRRIAQRPLLLEQESRANARRKAERKYTQILRDAGVEENLVNKLVTSDGRIIDADDDSEGDVDIEDNEDLLDSHEYSSTQLKDTSGREEYHSEESDVEDDSEVKSLDGSL